MAHPDSEFPPMTPVDDRPAPPRPKAVDTAFQLTLASIVLGAIGTAVEYLVDSTWVTTTIRQVLRDGGKPFTEDDVQAMVPVMKVAGALGIAAYVGLFLLFAFRMRAGRNWARMVLTVFAAFGVVGFLTSVSAEGAALALMWSLADAAFAVAAAVYMFRPESTAYFLPGRPRKAAH